MWPQLKYAPIAQLDRALPSGGRGREFESSWAHHIFLYLYLYLSLFKKHKTSTYQNILLYNIRNIN